MSEKIDTRRYDIDWLRTLAFFILILYHLAMYYVADWRWHIKSDQQSTWLQNIMLLTNTWRMSLLFFISAIAMSLVLQKNTFSKFSLVKIRSSRLLVPLIFSMLVVVPPQLYYELKQFYGFAGSYASFISEYLNINTSLAPQKQSPIGLLTWNHLWFLPYLWCYSIIILIIYPVLKALAAYINQRRVPAWLAMATLLLGTACIWFFLAKRFPTTHALLDDWYNHARYFWAFVAGFVLARAPFLWRSLVDCRRGILISAVLSYVWLLMDRQGLLNVGEALDKLWWIQLTHGLLVSINQWMWILAIVGYAGRYLRHSTPFIRYANQAILSWYILHQTLIIIFAMWLLPLNIPAEYEWAILLVLTLVGCFLGYELARRTIVTRWLFGLKA